MLEALRNDNFLVSFLEDYYESSLSYLGVITFDSEVA